MGGFKEAMLENLTLLTPCETCVFDFSLAFAFQSLSFQALPSTLPRSRIQTDRTAQHWLQKLMIFKSDSL
jgi:hypothetical protein